MNMNGNNTNKPVIEGYMHMVSYKNTDRLKAETAHHNPKGLTPDEMLNDILDRYFKLAAQMRV